MPPSKRKYSSSRNSSRKYSRTGYISSSTRMLMAARKGARLGYRKSGYTNRRLASTMSTKFVDGAISASASTTPVINLVATILQGPDETMRLGRNVVYTSLSWKGILQGGSAGSQSVARLIILYDRQPNRALPAAADILNGGTVFAMRNNDNQDRFVFLYDKVQSVIGTSTSTGTESAQRVWNKAIPLKKLVANYQSGATGAIGEITTGSLIYMTVGNLASGTTAPVFTLNFRTRFADV